MRADGSTSARVFLWDHDSVFVESRSDLSTADRGVLRVSGMLAHVLVRGVSDAG